MECLRRPVVAGLTCLSLLSAGFLAAQRPARADGVERGPVPLVLDVSRAGPVISPLLFGFNLEYTRYAMWKGLDAQMLANRSFAATSEEKSDSVKAGRKRSSRGPGRPLVRHRKAAGLFRAGHGGSLYREAVPANSGPGRGSKRRNRSARYRRSGRHGVRSPAATEGRFPGDGGRPASATARGKRSTAASRFDWKKETGRRGDFNWKAPQTDLQARLEVVFEGPGSLWVGAASLMPSDNFHGMRRDVVACLKEIGVPLLRWPGGSFTRDYRWKEGLAPLDKRPPIHCPLSSLFRPVSTSTRWALTSTSRSAGSWAASLASR